MASKTHELLRLYDLSEEEIASKLSYAPLLSITSSVIEVNINRRFNLTLEEFKAKWPEYSI